jgi:PST family polysaccharide transporter
LFGERWRAATPIIQILSLGLPFDSISWPAAAFLVAEGAFKRLFVFQTWSLPLFLGLAVVGAVYGSALGVACGVSLYYFIHPLGYTSASFNHRGVPIHSVVLMFFRLLACAALSFGPIYLAMTYSPLHRYRIAALAFGLAAGPPAYLVALFLFSRATFQSILDQALGLLGDRLEGLGRFFPLPRLRPPDFS